MPDRYAPGIRPSEITPEAVWLRRRELLAGAAALGFAGSIAEPAAAEALTTVKSPYSTDEKPTPLEDITSYNNFYEFGTDKGDPADYAGKLTTHPWTVKVDGLVAKPGDYQLEDILKPGHARGAHLSAALRRGLVDGDPLGRLPAGRPAQARRAPGQRQVRRLRDPGAAGRRCRASSGLLQALDWPYVEGLRLDEAMHPLDHPGRRPLRRDHAQPERRADPAGGAVEVRLQEHQVDRPDQPGRGAAADHLEPQNRRRVRLLFQRQPRGRPPALEPGDRAPHRRGRRCSPSAARPCRSTATPSRWRACTPAWTCARITDMAAVDPARLPWYQRLRPGALYFIGIIPAAWTFYLGVMDQLGADPMKVLERDLGLWALKFLVPCLAITPLRRLTGISLLRYRRAIGLLAFIYACLHLTDLPGARPGPRFRRDLGRHRQAPLHHDRHGGVPDPACRWRSPRTTR